MEYLLNVSTTDRHGDDIATISEASDLFLGKDYLIIAHHINALIIPNP